MPRHSSYIFLAIFIHSLFIISLQITLMRILTIMQWDSFANLVISIAMLGFGLSGTLLSLFERFFKRNSHWILPFSLIITALFIHLSFILSQSKILVFESLLVFQSFTHFFRFLIFVVLYFIPFFSGSLFLGLIFTHYVEDIHKHYFANLLGSAIGGIMALLLLEFLPPNHALIVISIFPCVAVFLLQIVGKHKLYLFSSLAVLLITLVHFIFPTNIEMSQYKPLSKVMVLPDAQKLIENHSFTSHISVVRSKYLHYTAPVGLQYSYAMPTMMSVFKNGNYAGMLIEKENDLQILDKSFISLIFEISNPTTACVMHSGTGTYARYLALKGIDNVYALEPDVGLLKTLNKLGEIGKFSAYSHPSIKLLASNPRFFIDSTRITFDLIVLPVLGSQTSGGNHNTLNEDFDLTKEAFNLYWTKLSQNGIMYVSCFLETPLRNSLKITGTITQMLNSANLRNFNQHLIAIRNWNNVAFYVKKTPFSTEELEKVETFCNNNGFDILLHPHLHSIDRQKFHYLADTSIFAYFDLIIRNRLPELQKKYLFKIEPPSDNRPYFSNFISITNLSQLLQNYSLRELFFIETHYFQLWASLIVLLICSLFFIILPLIRFSKRKGNWKIILYFGSIGFAYISLEISFIHSFAIYLGNHLYSTTAVLTIMLLFSGFGSFFSKKIFNNSVNWKYLFYLLLLIIILTYFVLEPILSTTISSHIFVKLFVMSLVIGIPSFIMGMPFPVGMKYFNKHYPEKIAWGWGINGFMSVCAVPITTLFSLEVGIKEIFLICTLIYAIALISVILYKKENVI